MHHARSGLSIDPIPHDDRSLSFPHSCCATRVTAWPACPRTRGAIALPPVFPGSGWCDAGAAPVSPGQNMEGITSYRCRLMRSLVSFYPQTGTHGWRPSRSPTLAQDPRDWVRLERQLMPRSALAAFLRVIVVVQDPISAPASTYAYGGAVTKDRALWATVPWATVSGHQAKGWRYIERNASAPAGVLRCVVTLANERSGRVVDFG